MSLLETFGLKVEMGGGRDVCIIKQAQKVVPDVTLLKTTSFTGNDKEDFLFIKLDVFQGSCKFIASVCLLRQGF